MPEHNGIPGRILDFGSKPAAAFARVRKSPRSGERKYSRSNVPNRSVVRRIPRFVLLTIGFLVLISLMAMAEALVIRLRWPHLADQASPHRVSIGDLAISPNGEWGVSRLTY